MSLSPRRKVFLGIIIGVVLIAAAITLIIGNDPIRQTDYSSVTASKEERISTAVTPAPTLPIISGNNRYSATNNLQMSGESVGTFTQWSVVELAFQGPPSLGMSDENNPFKQNINVTFLSPVGEEFVVPGFYQGNGQGGMDGNIWQVRFTPNKTGEWIFSSRSSHKLLDGHTGTFEVIPQNSCKDFNAGDLTNFNCLGRLDYTGRHYLEFSEGSFWLKGGVNEPEDFLALDVSAGFPNKEMAIDFLADQGVNSIYLVLHNIDGDGKNVWPWMGHNQRVAKKQDEYFDIEKLREWERIFNYIQNKGIVLHLVLEDDSAWTGFNRQMYYREIVARFAHHNGLIWNIAEEYNENYAPEEVSRFAEMLRELDPYDHPITVHHAGRTNQWEPFLNDQNIDLTSFQTNPRPQNDQANHWFDLINAADKTIPISFDETGQLEADERDLAREIIWSVYLGGANYEMFTKLKTGYPEFKPLFADLLRARKFIEQLPFESMVPCNGLLQPEEGYCLGNLGMGFIVYFPEGGSLSIDLSGMAGQVDALWFDPRTGEKFPGNQAEGGEIQTFSAPNREDWILQIGFNQQTN